MVGGPVSRALRTANPTLARQLTLEGRIEISLSLSLSLSWRGIISRDIGPRKGLLSQRLFPPYENRNILLSASEISGW